MSGLGRDANRKTGSRLPRLGDRLLPIVVLLILAPWVGEYLLGNVPATLIYALPILSLLYGCGALLVREIAVRCASGWAGILLLGVAYGVIEAGLVDQSMFNPEFQGHAFQAVTPIPALGISAYNTLAFLLGHAVWSIALPIAFVGFLFPKVRNEPWLGPVGWVVVLVFYLIGCRVIFTDLASSEGFVAADGQRIGAVAAALAFGAFGCLVPRGLRVPIAIAPPRPWLTGLLAFVLSGVTVAMPETWTGFGLKLGLIAFDALLVLALTRHSTWNIRHTHALASGVLLTYAWLGFVLTGTVRPDDSLQWIGSAVFTALAVLLVAVSRRKLIPGDH